MYKNIQYIIVGILSLLLHTIAQEQYPKVSCPDVFRYGYIENLGGHVGLIRIQKDSSPISELQVNMSMSTRIPVTNKIKIVVLSKQDEILYGNDIHYAVLFPSQTDIPKLTQILFNGKILCLDEPGPLESGVIQTSLWAKSIITTYGESFADPNKITSTIAPTPTQKNSAQFSLIFGSPPNSNSFPFEVPNNLPNNPFLFPQSQTEERGRLTTPIPQTPSPTPVLLPQTFPPQPITSSTSRPIVESTTKKVSRCGVIGNSVNLIIGGEGLSPGEFPWLAAIMHKEDRGPKLHCTGNLISDRHVLTAGHCVRYHNTPLYDEDKLIIVLGKLNMERWDTEGTIRTPKLIEIHPNYKQDNADYNIAIIHLNEPVKFRPNIRPICLWDKDDNLQHIIGTFGTVVGWNKDGAGDLDLVAQKVDMPVVSQEVCLRSNKVFKTYTSPRTFCAGTRDDTGPCTGDAGAGFMIKDISTNIWYLRGLVGFSLKDPVGLTCNLKNYVIFIDVAKMKPWIEQQIN